MDRRVLTEKKFKRINSTEMIPKMVFNNGIEEPFGPSSVNFNQLRRTDNVSLRNRSSKCISS